MSKNALQKRKRIAHFQNNLDNVSENGNALSECFDFVSSIIENMDSNFNTVHESSIKQNAKSKATNRVKTKNTFCDSPSTSSRINSPAKPKSYPNCKKFTTSRKFPLMEKSQKILKQLKHNRKIPKPRAHLAKLSTEATTESDATKHLVNSARKKETSKTKNNSDIVLAQKKNSECKLNFNQNSRKGIEVKSFQKSNKNTISSKSSRCSKKGILDKVSSSIPDCQNVAMTSNTSNVDKLKDSDNETTDSEYERFLSKNKKGLKRKVNKRKTSAKYKSSKKSQKKIQKTKRVSKQSDVENSDFNNSDSESLPNASSCKKPKVVNETEISTSEHEEIADDFCNTVSSDSEVERSVSPGKQKTHLKIPYSALRSVDSEDNMENLCNSPLQDIDSRNISETSVNHNMVLKNDSLNLNKNDSPMSPTAAPNLSETVLSNNDVKNDRKTAATNNMPLNKHSSCDNHFMDSCKKESNKLPPALYIDLCDSDDDSTNAASVNLPVAPMTLKNKHSVTDGDVSAASKKVNTKDSIASGSILKIPRKLDIKDLKTEEPISTAFAMKKDSVTDIGAKAKSVDIPILFFSEVEKNVPFNKDQSKGDSPSDESDIEIIDIVPTEQKRVLDTVTFPDVSKNFINNQEKCSTPTVNNIPNSANNPNYETAVQKEQSGNAIQMTLIKKDPNLTSNINHDAIYMTDICHEHTQSSLNDSFCDSSSKIIKVENEPDDEIVILEESCEKFPQNVSNHVKIKTQNLSNLTNKVKDIYANFKSDNKNLIHNLATSNVKNELSLVRLSSLKGENNIEEISSKTKLIPPFKHEQLCNINSNAHTHTQILSPEQKFAELERMNVNNLVQLYKKEFETYQEIVQTEESVEASLKLLEINQAEKLKYIRSLVLKYVDLNKKSLNTASANDEALKLSASATADSLKLFGIDIKNNPENFTFGNTSEKPLSLSKTSPSANAIGSSNIISDIKPNICPQSDYEKHSSVKPKTEAAMTLKDQISIDVPSSSQSGQKQILELSNQTCNVCGQEAIAACQRCAKVFFCSHECGKKFWINGHVNECG